jgi:hypothetical protein
MTRKSIVCLVAQPIPENGEVHAGHSDANVKVDEDDRRIVYLEVEVPDDEKKSNGFFSYATNKIKSICKTSSPSVGNIDMTISHIDSAGHNGLSWLCNDDHVCTS